MNPGHTLSTESSTARVQVIVAGHTLADTTRAVLLHETGLPTRYYVPRDDIDMERMLLTETTSNCPFKGDAEYWSAAIDGTVVADIAWSYPSPIPARADITGLVCFFDERVDRITVDGVAVVRPETPWSVAAEV
jgi:uncharacterized protein (DUF427 family)